MDMKKQRKAIHVANYVVDKFEVNNLHLQKLLYYLQVNYMYDNDGELLFNDTIEKWKLGPVIPDVYHAFKENGPMIIQGPHKDMEIRFDETSQSYKINYEVARLNDDELIKKIDYYLESLMKYDKFDLVDKTHEHEPWKRDEWKINSGIKKIPYYNEELIKYFRVNKNELLVERD